MLENTLYFYSIKILHKLIPIQNKTENLFQIIVYSLQTDEVSALCGPYRRRQL